MSKPLVVVYTTAGRLEADRIQNWLQAEGIPAMISQEGAGDAYGLAVGAMGKVDILVPATRAAEAQAWLAAMDAGELEQAQDAEAPDLPPAPADQDDRALR